MICGSIALVQGSHIRFFWSQRLKLDSCIGLLGNADETKGSFHTIVKIALLMLWIVKLCSCTWQYSLGQCACWPWSTQTFNHPCVDSDMIVSFGHSCP